MIEAFLSAAQRIDALLWGPWTMLFILGVSLYLTLRTRFFAVRKLGFILKRTFGGILKKPGAKGRGVLTPFQATTTALASTVGMGSIAGVATALSLGGPGALFWMWVLALLGMITKTAEVTLAVHYREIDARGRVRGGPMHYITKGLGWRPLAKVFSLSMFINAVFCASLLQAHTVGRAFLSSYGVNPYLTTGLMGLVTAVVVIGGVPRIGRFCEKLVPFMALVYIFGGLALFVLNAKALPSVLAMIVTYAFAPAPAAGAFAGAVVSKAIQNAMTKGMLVSEAGLGTAPMVHATADTPHPFQQGLWGAFEVFIVSFVICTITGFAILSSGVLGGGASGIDLAIAAFGTRFPLPLARALLSFTILTFCLSTQIGFFVYFETAVFFVFGEKTFLWLRWLYFVPAVAFAGVADVDRLWVLANIAVGLCAIPNLIAVLALSGVFLVLMKDCLSGQNRYATAIIDESRAYVRTARTKTYAKEGET
jgi:AGCS family alanine or glycine:cation symporter